MKRTINRAVSFVLICCVLSTFLFACSSSNNMSFQSEAEMKSYIKGTFDSKKGIIIIDGSKLVYIDKAEIFNKSESHMTRMLELLDGNGPEGLNASQLYKLCAENKIGIYEHSIDEYQYKKGRIVYGPDSEKLNINTEGNLEDEDGVIYVWLSDETGIPTDALRDPCDEYKLALKEYRLAVIKSRPVPEDDLISAMNTINYSPEALSGWYSAPIGEIIARACPDYSISYSHYEAEKMMLLDTQEISNIEQKNSAADLENAYFVTVKGNTRYSPSTDLATDTETVAVVLIVLDSTSKPVYFSYIEISDTLEMFALNYLL